VKYAFIRAHQDEFVIRNLCHMLRIHRSGYYAWLNQPKSARQKEYERLTGFIKQFWLESGCVYGYCKIHKDLRELGETCGKNRVARLMKLKGLKARSVTGNHAIKAVLSLSWPRITSSRISMSSNPIRPG
jgi:putative transposase